MPVKRRRLQWVFKKLWFVGKWALVFGFIIFVMPLLKQLLFPDLMTRLEKLLHRSKLENCTVEIQRLRDSWMVVQVRSGEQAVIQTEISKYVLEELPQENESRVFIAHSINHNPDQSYYLTETRIWADADLKRVLRLEASYCGRLRAEDGRVAFDGDLRPVYECVDPVQRYVCDAAVTE